MTDEELQEHIALLRRMRTDFRHVEAKLAWGGLPTRLWETLSAFANTSGGGVIILGLDEGHNFEVVGVENPRKTLQDLASMTAEMEPRLTPVIDIKEIDGRALVVAEVPEMLPSQKPCYYRPAGHSNGAFVRVADGDRKLNSYEVQLMLSSRGQPVDDQGAVPNAGPKDLDQASLTAFLKHVRERRPRFRAAADQRILRSLKVLVPHPDDSNRFVPSVAGLLVFGREPQSFFPQFSVLVTAYPGREIGEPGPHAERMLDDARIDGSIGRMLAETLVVIARNLRQPRIATGPTRRGALEIPVAALSEAVVNALAHRDLSPQSRGTAVQVQLFLDRLIITNPGGLFGPVSVDTLGSAGVTSARNATLMQLLEDAVTPRTGEAIVEHRGTGIPVMIQALRAADMSPPRFEDGVSTFCVTFPRHSLVDPQTLNWLAGLGDTARGLSRDQRNALVLMKAGEAMSNVRYRQISDADSRVATRELADLVNRGLAEVVGGGRYTEYVLASLVGQADTKPGERSERGERADRRPEIRQLLAGRGEMSRAALQAELGLGQSIVSRWLRRMLKDREIELTTSSERSPGAKYRLHSSKSG
ncbi:MAG: putative DNA binding domain-containing protein [Proteobacteria bacterium]|nr:putative DNA binding domain-containing protein [Pseudomonadota bacterium]